MKLRAGHRAWVTGAAGGIGSAVVDVLRARGMIVDAIDLRHDGIAPAGVLHHTADLQHAETRAALVAKLGPPDLLVHAAVHAQAGLASQTPNDAWIQSLQVGLGATIALSNAATAHMQARGRGQIVLLSSAVADAPLPGLGVYAADKAATRAWMRALRAELRATPVGVCVLTLGLVHTAIATRTVVHGDSASAWRQRMAKLYRRGLKPERVAAAMVRAVEKDTPELRLGLDALLLAPLSTLAARLKTFEP